jgi:nucleoside-diphosphate kinase
MHASYKLVAIKLMTASKEHLEKHYADLSDKPFFKGLVSCRFKDRSFGVKALMIVQTWPAVQSVPWSGRVRRSSRPAASSSVPPTHSPRSLAPSAETSLSYAIPQSFSITFPLTRL